METLTYLIYTHSEYDDILEIHLKRLHKHFPTAPLSICTNNKDYIINKYSNVYKINKIYEYDDSKPYGEKLQSVIEQIDTKYIWFIHDVNILVGDIDPRIIQNILIYIESNKVDQLRLMISGIDTPILNSDIQFNKIIANSYYFSVCLAIWDKTILLDIVTKFKNTMYRDIENTDVQSYASKFNSYYLSSNKDTPFVGEGHYLSHYIPYVHSLYQGRWITSSPTNNKLITDISNEYSIDLTKRGCK